jgi:hypothetical protein
MRIQIEARWPRFLQSRPRRFAVVALVTLFALGVPTALATHDFTDVPDGNPFHAEISALKGAGITGGKTCVPPGTPPTFCPDEPLVRQAMAAFLNRGLSRAALNNTLLNAVIPFSGDFPTDTLVGQVVIEVGGAGAGVNQFIHVQGQLSVGDNSAGTGTTPPPYTLFYYLAEGDQVDPANRSIIFNQRIRDANSLNDTVPISWVRPAGPGVHTIKLHAWTEPGGTAATATIIGLTATTHAFGSIGTSTLGTTQPNQPRPGR